MSSGALSGPCAAFIETSAMFRRENCGRRDGLHMTRDKIKLAASFVLQCRCSDADLLIDPCRSSNLTFMCCTATYRIHASQTQGARSSRTVQPAVAIIWTPAQRNIESPLMVRLVHDMLRIALPRRCFQIHFSIVSKVQRSARTFIDKQHRVSPNYTTWLHASYARSTTVVSSTAVHDT